jgi:ISXO2-like transposase domain
MTPRTKANAREVRVRAARKDEPALSNGEQVHRVRSDSVDHSKFEWTRGDVHTNTLEGFFSIFKRGLIGVYQHVDKRHLDRYLAEFDFRQNTRARLGINDVERADIALADCKGKRLTYQTTDRGRSA